MKDDCASAVWSSSVCLIMYLHGSSSLSSLVPVTFAIITTGRLQFYYDGEMSILHPHVSRSKHFTTDG